MLTRELHLKLFSNSPGEGLQTHKMPPLNHILLVDDDDVANFIHEDLFLNLKAAEKISIAENGKIALEIILQNSANLPELVFLDINMPVMNGFDFLESLADNAPNDYKAVILVMQTTAFTREDHLRMNSLKHLVSGFVDKPLTEQIIQTAIEKYF